jgi:hypothetical protein
MVSNNVWVEATIHPDSAKEMEAKWKTAIPEKNLHITMAFTNILADTLDSEKFIMLCDSLANCVSDLPSLLDDEIEVGGVAVLGPDTFTAGVLLLQSQLLWSYNRAFSHQLTTFNQLDLKYPGWLPHVTLAFDVGANTEDIYQLHHLATVLAASRQPIKVDGLWLRAGRMCLPL